MTHDQPRILVVHPSSELYGSDRVALESVRAFIEAGAQVHAALAGYGPLAALMSEAGARVHVLRFPVLRKAYLSAPGLARLLALSLRTIPSMVGLLRRVRPNVVYVSTVTVPWWLVLARLHGTRVLCHVHEAEDGVPRLVRLGLAAPLVLAHRIVANSRASRAVVVEALPRLGGRTQVVHNGVPGPPSVVPARPVLEGPVRLVLVGRVSPRKGTDVAVAALALLRQGGIPATLDLVGGVFPGYEWFATVLARQVAEAGLTGQVRCAGVRCDVWPALADADIALVPSRVEPFGNAAVEAMLAGRPVVAGRTQGLCEIVVPGENGWLARPGDAEDLAAAITKVVLDWPAARQVAGTARAQAVLAFDPARYRRRIAAATLGTGGVDRLSGSGRRYSQ